MNQFAEIIPKFQTTLPAIRSWINALLEANKDKTTPVIHLRLPKLQQVFPNDLLEKAKVVTVTGKVPFPPLSRFGLSELAEMEEMSLAGITYEDTFFINQSHLTESLHFPELVHVVQWETLGVDNFLMAYGVGLMQFGYENSPLEQMAYSLQRDFDMGHVPKGIIELIQQQTEGIWNKIAPLVYQT